MIELPMLDHNFKPAQSESLYGAVASRRRTLHKHGMYGGVQGRGVRPSVSALSYSTSRRLISVATLALTSKAELAEWIVQFAELVDFYTWLHFLNTVPCAVAVLYGETGSSLSG